MELQQLLPVIKQEVFNNEILNEFLKKSEIDNFLHKHFSIIKKYLNNEHIDTSLYENSSIPFVFIYKSLKIIKHATNNKKLDDFEALIAKTYLKKDIKNLEDALSTPYDETLLFRYHYVFIKNVIRAIENENLLEYPLLNPNECEFKKILNFPQAKMILQNEKNIDKIEKLHNLLHKSANALYFGYVKKNYADAYFTLQQLKEYLFRFIKHLSELYFKTFTNIEEHFFSTAYEFHKSKDIFLTIIDIRNLKNFNLIYGERVVNKALKIINNRLQSFMKNDYSKTLTIKADSADFFMLNIDINENQYKELIDEIYQELTLPIVIGDLSINLPIIIAGSKIEKDLIVDKDTLVHSLVLLKENAKKENREIYIINHNELNEILKTDKENFIIEKLNNKEVDVVFQPIFKTQNKELYSLEVLGRIKDKENLLPAGMFIDKIYELNLIEKFDSLILEKLIEKEEAIKEITDKIFLNISFQSLLNPEYMKKLKKFLEVFNIEVILELTEQKFVSDLDLIKDIYDKYKIKFAVDDFGTGYSSLHLVVELIELGILKILKIDGTLIKDLEKNENLKKIVSLISKLGHDFNLLTVAEFVENENILEFLKDINISLSQGYYLSKPKTIDELLKEKEKFADTKRKNLIYKLVY